MKNIKFYVAAVILGMVIFGLVSMVEIEQLLFGGLALSLIFGGSLLIPATLIIIKRGVEESVLIVIWLGGVILMSVMFFVGGVEVALRGAGMLVAISLAGTLLEVAVHYINRRKATDEGSHE